MVTYGEADIAFVVDVPNDVELQPLYDDYFVLVARRTEFTENFRSEIPIEALAGQQIVASTGGCTRVVSAAMSAANVSVSYPAVARETSTALALVQAGVGVSILPRLLVPELPSALVCFDIVPRMRGVKVIAFVECSGNHCLFGCHKSSTEAMLILA